MSEGERQRAEAFKVAYQANYDDLWLYCLRRTSSVSAAEEVLGDTLATAWEKVAEMPSGDEARMWLFGLARNFVRNDWRKSKRRGRVHLQLVSNARRDGEAVTDLGPELLAVDQSAEVVDAFRSLRPQEQEVLSLAAWEGLSQREISSIVGCSENAVKVRLHRARKRMSKELEKRRNVSIGSDMFVARTRGEEVTGE